MSFPDNVSGVSLPADQQFPVVRVTPARRPRRKLPHSSRVERRQVAQQEAWELALELAGGDARRLRPQLDGSVIVVNQPGQDAPGT